jgi:hypothetical protein
MSRPALALLAAALLAAPVMAGPVTLPCRLPAQGRFTLAIEEHGWTREGLATRVTIRRDLDIMAEGEGRLVRLGPPRATSNLTGPARERFDMVFGRPDERPVHIHVDAAGRVGAIDDLDAHWRAYLDTLGSIAALAEKQDDGGARTRALIAGLARADPETRRAAIAGSVVPLLRLCGRSVEAEPGAPDGLWIVVERDGGEAVAGEARYHVAPDSGLVMAIDRRLTPRAQPDRPKLEYWRLEPRNG